MICLFHRNGKMLFWNGITNHLLHRNLTIRCQKVENGLPDLFSKLLANLIDWKNEYLIAQLRAEFQQKLFRLKTCP
jgi:hypothetical protein